MDAVAARLGAHIENRIAGRGAARIENLVLVCEADRHRIDEDIAIIALVELGFTRNRRHANAIAITANARDHASDQAARLWVVRRTKAQSVDQRNRPRAHGEHVAQNTTDAGRRALIGFDV